MLAVEHFDQKRDLFLTVFWLLQCVLWITWRRQKTNVGVLWFTWTKQKTCFWWMIGSTTLKKIIQIFRLFTEEHFRRLGSWQNWHSAEHFGGLEF